MLVGHVMQHLRESSVGTRPDAALERSCDEQYSTHTDDVADPDGLSELLELRLTKLLRLDEELDSSSDVLDVSEDHLTHATDRHHTTRNSDGSCSCGQHFEVRQDRSDFVCHRISIRVSGFTHDFLLWVLRFS